MPLSLERLADLHDPNVGEADLLAALADSSVVVSATAALVLAGRADASLVPRLKEVFRASSSAHVCGSVSLVVARTAKAAAVSLSDCLDLVCMAGTDAYTAVHLLKACRRSARSAPVPALLLDLVREGERVAAGDPLARAHLLKLYETILPVGDASVRRAIFESLFRLRSTAVAAAPREISALEFSHEQLSLRIVCTGLLAALSESDAALRQAAVRRLEIGDLGQLLIAAAADDALLITLVDRLSRLGTFPAAQLLSCFAAALEWDALVCVDLIIGAETAALAATLRLFRQCAADERPQKDSDGRLGEWLGDLSRRLSGMHRRGAMPFNIAPLLRQLDAAHERCTRDTSRKRAAGEE